MSCCVFSNKNDDCAVITSFFGSEENSDKAFVVELPLNDIKSNGTMKDSANYIHSLTKGQIVLLNYNTSHNDCHNSFPTHIHTHSLSLSAPKYHFFSHTHLTNLTHRHRHTHVYCILYTLRQTHTHTHTHIHTHTHTRANTHSQTQQT